MSPATLQADIFRSLLIGSFEVRRPTLTSDGAGGSTESLSTVGTVDGRLRPLLPREIRPMDREGSAGRVEVEFDHVLYVEAPTSIQRGDYVRDAARPGVRYRVVDLVEPSYAAHHVAVRLMRERD